ncbi:hypothetical protein ACFWDN_13300 [Micromonospora chalcea]
MAKVNLTLCDVCADRTKDASPYTIKSRAGNVSTDLCEDCAKPINELLDKLKDRPVPKTRGRVPVTTVEDIERMKERAGKK